MLKPDKNNYYPWNTNVIVKSLRVSSFVTFRSTTPHDAIDTNFHLRYVLFIPWRFDFRRVGTHSAIPENGNRYAPVVIDFVIHRTSANLSTVNIEPMENWNAFEGDIDGYSLIEGRSAVASRTQLWPNATVPYEIDPQLGELGRV